MKKLMFTAIAVIAFSGVTMAKTVETKEEVVANNENKVELVVKNDQDATPCQDKAINFYEYLMNNFYSGGDNIGLLNALLSNC